MQASLDRDQMKVRSLGPNKPEAISSARSTSTSKIRRIYNRENEITVWYVNCHWETSAILLRLYHSAVSY